MIDIYIYKKNRKICMANMWVSNDIYVVWYSGYCYKYILSFTFCYDNFVSDFVK